MKVAERRRLLFLFVLSRLNCMQGQLVLFRSQGAKAGMPQSRAASRASISLVGGGDTGLCDIMVVTQLYQGTRPRTFTFSPAAASMLAGFDVMAVALKYVATKGGFVSTTWKTK